MTEAGQLDRKVTFYQPARDANGEAAAPTESVTRQARIQPMKGGEAVQADRMAGRQPVIITVRRDNTTRLVDNGWFAKDARAAADSPPESLVWDIQSKIVTEDLMWVQLLATQNLAGDVIT